MVGDVYSSLIGFWLPDVGPRMMLMDDNELALACKDYLYRIGTRQFRNDSELAAAAERERWPGWDSHSWRFQQRGCSKPKSSS